MKRSEPTVAVQGRLVDADEYFASASDITSDLRRWAESREDGWTLLIEAADEITTLRAALALAVGELSTHGEYAHWSPETLMDQILGEARDDRP